jgi:hypothetical protein
MPLIFDGTLNTISGLSLTTLTANVTDAMMIPKGNTAQRPASANTGMIRFNTTLNYTEEYRGGQWVPLSSLVLQVAWTNWNGSYTGASASNVDFTGFNTTFTPLYSTSKVLIIVSAGVNFICDGSVYIKRNGTIIKDSWFASGRGDDQYDYPQAAQTYLDSPNTTSTITYQMGGRAPGCGNIIRFGASDNSSSICLMEIAA